MIKINSIKYFVIFLIAGLVTLNGCNDPVYDFGYDGELSGKITDNNGNIVSGDIKVATYAVHALGENDLVSMVMRVRGDGHFANTKLYPQSYKVWLVGPFIDARTDTIVVDLTGGQNVVRDFQVTPLLTITEPSVSGSPASTSVSINYSIAGNGGNVPNLREVIVSTVAWPTRTTGSGMGYQSRIAVVTQNQGTATVEGLNPGTKYYVRVGARAAGQTLFNHSEQISFTTPQ